MIIFKKLYFAIIGGLLAAVLPSCTQPPPPASPPPVVAVAAPQAATAQAVFVISTTPYYGPEVPAVMEMLRAAYRTISIEVTFEVMPGERSLVSADSGKVDADLHRIDGITRAYPHLVKVPVALAHSQLFAWVKRDGIKASSLDELKHYSIAYTRGFKAIEYAAETGFNMVPCVDDIAAFQMLAAGRVDVVITDIESGDTVIQKLELKGIRNLGNPVQVVALYHCVNEKHVALVPSLVKVLSAMKPYN